MVVCRAYIIGVGQLLQHQDFQRRMEGKQTAFFWGGGISIYQSSYYFAKNKGFKWFVCFFIKMKKLKEKFKNFKVWVWSPGGAMRKCARLSNPCARITNSCAWFSNPCARFSNPCARISVIIFRMAPPGLHMWETRIINSWQHKIPGHSRLHVDKSPGYFEDFPVIK